MDGDAVTAAPVFAVHKIAPVVPSSAVIAPESSPTMTGFPDDWLSKATDEWIGAPMETDHSKLGDPLWESRIAATVPGSEATYAGPLPSFPPIVSEPKSAPVVFETS